MFYQQPPEAFQLKPKEDYFEMQKARGLFIQTHLHVSYEFLCCDKGQISVTISGREYILEEGDAVLIFPYQPHSYPKNRDGYGYRCTFAQELIGRFATTFGNYLPKSNQFRFSYDISGVDSNSNIFAIKSFLYAVCAKASEELEFEYVPADSRILLEKIFVLTEEHYTDTSFSLRTLAEMLTYDYGYISKYFVQKTGMKFNHYLNLRRITHAAGILRNAHPANISDVAFSCGYSSVRSFNRNFKNVYGVTPQEYVL